METKMEMKKYGVWQKLVYVFLYSLSLIGWAIGLLYANIYRKMSVNSDAVPLVIVIVLLLIHWGICFKFVQFVSRMLPQNSPENIWVVQGTLYVIAVILTILSGLKLAV